VSKAKPYSISKQAVWEAYKRVKANRGAAGVDKQTLGMFEKDLKDNLYKVWNRMSSGSYFPPPVRLVEIPKGRGKRALGIPTVSDRVAQTVAKMYLEPIVESKFHEDSYGSRPGKSALDAVATARKRCWRRDWVVDLDIKGFFDNLDWNLVMRAVRFHTNEKWLHLYIERWLRAPIEMEDGSLVERTKGSPQGSVVSPLLANLFMHHAFDDWMTRNHPNIQFERYVDDVVVHCVSEKQAKFILAAVRRRLGECGLELHPEKTKTVYCKDDDRRGKFEVIKFDFLGYTFQPRRAKNRYGKHFVSFLPAISIKSANKIRATICGWRIAAKRNNQSLEDLAKLTDPYVRGWMNYYGRFYRSKCIQVLRYLNVVLVKWVRRKYKDRFRRKERKAAHWLGRIAKRDPHLMVLWKLGIKPAAGR
jgi:RNA-directed DNA polymerase